MSALNLLIFGASARAAAFSALRAGLNPWCADLFGDADLTNRCPVIRVSAASYPHGFQQLAGHELSGPWIYTGSLENWPFLVQAIARRRALWGNGAPELFQARSPEQVASVLQAAGLPHPALAGRHPDAAPLAGRRYLVKPVRGGSTIRPWVGDQTHSSRRQPVYLQEFIEGEPCASLYLAERRGTWLLGVTRQLVGESWLHAPPYRYCGSLGPLSVTPAFERLGTALGTGCSLRGLFGVDCVLHNGVPYPVEVNPRYTASVEVLEYALGVPVLSLHRAVFDPGTGSQPALRECGAPGKIVGKAILFAREALTFPADGPWMTTLHQPGDIWDMPAYADIPHPGEPIEKGKPILTFFARADSAAACTETLKQLALDLDRCLFGG